MAVRLDSVARSRRGVIRGAVAAFLATAGLTRERESAAGHRKRRKGRNGNRSAADAFGIGGAGGAGGDGGNAVIRGD
jgi:hypothetical protein